MGSSPEVDSGRRTVRRPLGDQLDVDAAQPLSALTGDRGRLRCSSAVSVTRGRKTTAPKTTPTSGMASAPKLVASAAPVIAVPTAVPRLKIAVAMALARVGASPP